MDFSASLTVTGGGKFKSGLQFSSVAMRYKMTFSF